MELQELTEKLSEVKTQLAIKQNTFDELSKKIKEEFDISTVEEAEKKAKEIEKKLTDLSTKKETLMEKANKLLENYESE